MKLKTLKLNSTKGTKLIKDATDIFSGYIDSDFKNWNLDKQKPTKAMTLEIHEMEKDGTFKDIFTNPEKQAMTQEQIIDFCKNHRDQLRTDGCATLFLFKNNNDFFVARVSVYDGRLRVLVHQFADGCVWDARCRHRFVFPQLTPRNLESSDPLELGHLVARIESLENTLNKIGELLTSHIH